MKYRKLTLEEKKALQLEMLKEIDSFCRANNIKYALSCGTLIGAVRHQGFIPWDDDVDITMHYTDVLRFREIFSSNTMKYCDIDTEKNFYYCFSRIASEKTYHKKGIHRQYGVSIDLYPIIECTSDKEKINRLIDKGCQLLKRRLLYIKYYSRILRYTPLSTLPGFKKAIRDYYNFMINEVQTIGGGNYYQIGGPLIGDNNNFYRNLWSFDPLEKLEDAKFEDANLLIPYRYDELLKIRYGDYMQLPPEENRRPYHGGNYYWK